MTWPPDIGRPWYYSDDAVCIAHADCRDVLPLLPKVDLVLTDPPYPDDPNGYAPCSIGILGTLDCRQFVFWSSKVEFPLDYTAIHIWDKLTGCASEYERLFERKGHVNFKMFRSYFINSTVAAQYNHDIFTGHPSQKPLILVKNILLYAGNQQVILDPFCGSGTTLRAAKDLGRRAIGIEIELKYCEIAAKRMSQSVMRLGVVA